MKKAAIVAKDESKISSMKKILGSKGIIYDSNNPDFVISLGGDGTFLVSEHKYPGVPKLLIRDSKICKKCVGSNEKTMLDFLKVNAYTVKEEEKLEANFKGEKIIAVNDIIIRNKIPNQAIRLEIHIDDEKQHDELIGDGLLVSTPFGSTAYFKSITRETFDEGIGVAFNNSVEEYPPVYLNENNVLKVKLVRGDAEIAYDNISKMFILKEGETIAIKKSKEIAKLIRMDGFEL